MNSPFFSRPVYFFLFSLLGLVYIIGLFVPLMDNDSAHHANIALHMFLTGNYTNLVDHGGAYLDKPHLHFWLCAFSYTLFGVNSFAYKFPSLLFTILGVYSTFRLGKTLYNKEVGKLAALILVSAFAFILANNDVRMDAILTSAIAFATWQLLEFVQRRKTLNVAGAALGLAIGFSTKGLIGVFVPGVAVLFFLLYRKDWKIFLSWKWWLMLVLFGLFIFPVVYCYYLQFNLHPEIWVRGKDHINGVKFILLNQSAERFSGQMSGDVKHDYLFFLHSFLWALAPWSLLAYLAVGGRIKTFLNRGSVRSNFVGEEWLTAGVFIIILLVVTCSGSKLPHYLNIVFPSTAVLVAAFIVSKKDNGKWTKVILIIGAANTLLLLLLMAFINAWAFPVHSAWVISCMILMLAVVFYFIKSSGYTTIQKAIAIPIATMAFSFFLLNSNFYPRLLEYQGGNELAFSIRGEVNPNDVYYWKDSYSSSYDFYTANLHKPFADSLLKKGKIIWLLFDIINEEKIKNAGYHLGRRFSTLDYEITKLNIKFVNPARRESQCTKLELAEIEDQH